MFGACFRNVFTLGSPQTIAVTHPAVGVGIAIRLHNIVNIFYEYVMRLFQNTSLSRIIWVLKPLHWVSVNRNSSRAP